MALLDSFEWSSQKEGIWHKWDALRIWLQYNCKQYLSSSDRICVLKECLIYISDSFWHFFDAGLSQPLQGPYIDVQWPWHKAFDMVKNKTNIRHPSSASGTVFWSTCHCKPCLLMKISDYDVLERVSCFCIKKGQNGTCTSCNVECSRLPCLLSYLCLYHPTLLFYMFPMFWYF